ncbi:MAG: hypothetical protein JXQ30_16740, partial [Spirochaetes bacterium]|nr:hypothetical protein [Spirochaetota bacterium]
MYTVVKQYCIFHGSCEVGDVVQVEKPSEYMVKLDGRLPKCGIETRGIEPAQVCAYDLPFQKRKIGAAADTFIMLYRSCPKCAVEFWSISVSKGMKATIKILDTKAAAKLFDELPVKALSRTFLFSPAAYRREVE